MSQDDTVNIIGVKADGSADLLGQARMTPKMKAREIVLSYFGRIDEESADEGAMALWACEELAEWMAEPKTGVTPGGPMEALHPIQPGS